MCSKRSSGRRSRASAAASRKTSVPFVAHTVPIVPTVGEAARASDRRRPRRRCRRRGSALRLRAAAPRGQPPPRRRRARRRSRGGTQRQGSLRAGRRELVHVHDDGKAELRATLASGSVLSVFACTTCGRACSSICRNALAGRRAYREAAPRCRALRASRACCSGSAFVGRPWSESSRRPPRATARRREPAAHGPPVLLQRLDRLQHRAPGAERLGLVENDEQTQEPRRRAARSRAGTYPPRRPRCCREARWGASDVGGERRLVPPLSRSSSRDPC